MSKEVLIEALNDLMKHVATSAGHTALHDLIREIEECGLQALPAVAKRNGRRYRSV